MSNNLVLLNNPHFIIDMMYARPNNMGGRAVYQEIDFGKDAYLHKDAIKALLLVVPFLEKHNLKMRVCDAYRPPIAHQKFLQILPYSQIKLFAEMPEKSNHCHGTAVDVCLTNIHGQNLVYPTEIDAYEKRFQEQVNTGYFAEYEKHLQKACHDYMDASPEALQNRQTLKDLMESVGFESIPHEWWHYNLKGWQNYPMIEWSREKNAR